MKLFERSWTRGSDSSSSPAGPTICRILVAKESFSGRCRLRHSGSRNDATTTPMMKTAAPAAPSVRSRERRSNPTIQLRYTGNGRNCSRSLVAQDISRAQPLWTAVAAAAAFSWSDFARTSWIAIADLKAVARRHRSPKRFARNWTGSVRRLLLHDAHVRDRLALRHRGHGADEQHDARRRRVGLEDRPARVVGDGSDLHPLCDVRSAADELVEDSGLIAAHALDALHPDRTLDRRHGAGQHLQIPHHVETAVRQQLDVVGLRRAGVTRLDGDGRLATRRGGVLEIARGGRIFGTIRRDDDRVDAESQQHLAGDSILLRVAADSPIAVGAQAFVEVAAVQIDQVVGPLDDFLR